MNDGNIILTGFMGSGKSSVGQALALKLRLPLLDTDRLIEEEAGMTINEIFKSKGQPAFRAMETELLEKLKRRKDRYILSVGGGVPLFEKNRKLLKELGTVILLDSSVESYLERLSEDTTRPNLKGEGSLKERIEALLHERMPEYLKGADLIIDNEGRTVEETSEMIIMALGSEPAGI